MYTQSPLHITMSLHNSTEMTAPTGTMPESLIGRLPGELRNKVYGYLMESDSIPRGHPSGLEVYRVTTQEGKSLAIRKKLAPLQVCRQMRAEAIGYFFDEPIWLSHQIQILNENYLAMVAPTEGELKNWSAMLSKIPMHLRSPWMTFEYRHEYVLIKDTLLTSEPIGRGADFKAGIRALVKAVRPHKVVVVINLFFHSMGRAVASNTRPSEPGYVCIRDQPMTVADCESILVKISTSDAVEAYRLVKHAFAEKRRELEAHRAHRVCFIRLSLGLALARLEIAEKRMRVVLEHMPGFPGPSRE
jgi:hypothetical protein